MTEETLKEKGYTKAWCSYQRGYCRVGEQGARVFAPVKKEWKKEGIVYTIHTASNSSQYCVRQYWRPPVVK